MKHLIHAWRTEPKFRSDARRLVIVATFWSLVAFATLALLRLGILAAWAVFEN